MSLRNQPYLPLYVQDFLTDEKLIECSAQATGVYIRLLCIMHKSEEYGTILLRQKDWQNTYQNTYQIKNFATKLLKHLPYTLEVIESSLEELVNEGVLQIEGCKLLQKRMIRDNHISIIRKQAGSKGGFAKAKSVAKDIAKGVANAEYEYETEYENKDENENEKIKGSQKNGVTVTEKKELIIGDRKLIADNYFLGLLPVDLETDKILAWADWVDYRKEIKKKLAKSTALKQINFLLSQPNFINCINQSITNGWQGLFPEKENDGSRTNQQRRKDYVTKHEYEAGLKNLYEGRAEA